MPRRPLRPSPSYSAARAVAQGRRVTAWGAAALALASAPASADTSAGFYDPPASLPAANGAVVRTEPMRLALRPGIATRIMYRSTDANGLPVAVTGTYIEPEVPYSGQGPRPLVVFAPGTQGQADGCAPSYGLERGLVSRVAGGTNFGYEGPVISQLVRRGAAVVVTDYVGLGTTDRLHTYMSRLDQGHAVLDAARAALRLPGTSITGASAVGVYGYSQGGAAAGAAVELATGYAPEVNLAAAYVGGPPADLAAVMRAVDGTALTGVIGYAVNGFVQTYPQLGRIVDAEATPTGKRVLQRLTRQCELDSMATFGFQRTTRWLTGGRSIAQLAATDPMVRDVVDAQRLGRAKPPVPVLVLTGTRDDIVPHRQARQLAVDWCALGAEVTYIGVRQSASTGGTGGNHVSLLISHTPTAQRWLIERLAGSPPASNCAALADRP